MILVTLGTQTQKFYRLLNAVENLNTKESIIVQAGGSYDYKSKKMKIKSSFSYDEMEKLIDDASIIITHGGTGSIVTPLKKDKKVIACARLEKYKEHINDHQKEIVSIFNDEGYLLEFSEKDDLNEIYIKAKNFKPKKYKSNKEQFIKKIKEEIDN